MESIWFEMLEQLEDGLQYQLVLTQRLLCNLFPAFPGPLLPRQIMGIEATTSQQSLVALEIKGEFRYLSFQLILQRQALVSRYPPLV